MSRTDDDARTGTAAAGAEEYSESAEDGTVLPTSDWSVDDDGPANIDPLLKGSDRKNGAGSIDQSQNQPTGEVPVTEVVPVARDDQPRRSPKRARQADTTEVVTAPPIETDHRDPRRWDVEDDLGPWQSNREFIAPVAPTLYPADDHAADLEPGRRVMRRTTRILRHVDPWSTFKVGLLFSLVGYLVTMTSGVLLWNVAARTGTLDNVERWFTQFGWETFSLDGSSIFTNSAIAGLFLAVGATGAMVMFATIFNLASDAIGGIRLTVLEESRVRLTDDDLYGHVDPSYGIHLDPRADWDLDD